MYEHRKELFRRQRQSLRRERRHQFERRASLKYGIQQRLLTFKVIINEPWRNACLARNILISSVAISLSREHMHSCVNDLFAAIFYDFGRAGHYTILISS